MVSCNDDLKRLEYKDFITNAINVKFISLIVNRYAFQMGRVKINDNKSKLFGIITSLLPSV